MKWCLGAAGAARMMDQRPNRAQVIQSADVFVDSAGLVACTDYNAVCTSWSSWMSTAEPWPAPSQSGLLRLDFF